MELWYRTGAPPGLKWKSQPQQLLQEWIQDVTEGKKWVVLHQFEIRNGELHYLLMSEPGNKWVLEPYTAIKTLANLIQTEEFK